jgi:hypothetical protein
VDYLIDFSDSTPDELYVEHLFSDKPIDPDEIWESWLGITLEKGQNDERLEPTIEQQSAINYFAQNQEEVFESIAAYILTNKSKVFDGYMLKDNMFPDYINELKTKKDIYKQLNLSSLFLKLKTKEGLSYMGLFGNCDWDPEHGCGI